MNTYEALYRVIKENMPDTLNIVFNNLDENTENCGVCFKGTGSDPVRKLDGSLGNRSMRLIINYNTKDVFAGFEYGEQVVERLIQIINMGYRDDDTGELLVAVNNIKLVGNINYLGKNRNNSLNCFSINFLVTYGLL